MTRWVGRICASGLLACAAALAAGSDAAHASGPSMFSPHSPSASSITDLMWIMLGLALAVFVIVEGLLVYVLIRFRARRGDQRAPSQSAGNLRIELIWTGIPVVLVAVLFGLTLHTMSTLASAPANALHVQVIGHQFWWEYRYPGSGAVTANELVVPVGRPVQLDLYAQDVIHSWWVPELAGKEDLIPGKHNTLWFTAEQARTYLGQCAEFCGLQHAGMLLRVTALPPDQFQSWEAQQAAAAAAPAPGAAQQGAAVFAQRTCISCHAVRGQGAEATVAPDLTHFGSRATLAAGVLDNTPQNLARWLADPQAVKPGNLMPNLKLSSDEIQQLVAYLEGLK
ncbi:MAG TPA: cytochrome c oxidase subunit II [Dehalococcoidia bacterium]|nr:cytochrome c oxidase subunit II [Dehalococcoidia bacterium]